jgi:quercetin dioxygenase-like cupin family protein
VSPLVSSRRRIVTGHNPDGRSVVVSDSIAQPRTSPGLPGQELLYLWGTDAPSTYPDDGREPNWTQHFPPLGGLRFVTMTVQPEDTQNSATLSAEAIEHARSTFPGLFDTYQDDDPGMHTSASTDVAIVLRGEIELGLDDGSTHTLHAGDTIIQNGTAHSWTNHSSEPVEVLFVLVGARTDVSS